MYSKYPARPGEPPVKVVFEGIEPGSPEAQQLFFANQAAIQHFHAKARQNRDISGQAGAHMQQAQRDGGQFRYSYNNGIETVHIKLSPQRIERQLREPPPPELPPIPPTLAVDVLFETPFAELGNVWWYAEKTTTRPGTPGENYPSVVIYQASVEYWQSQFSSDTIWDEVYAGGTVYGNGPSGTVLGLEQHDQLVARGPQEPWNIMQTYVIMKRHAPPGLGQPYYVTEAFTLTMATRPVNIPPGPPVTVTEKVYTHDQRSFFKTLNLVGAQGNPEGDPEKDPPYVARTPGESDDGRLVPCEELKIGKEIERILPPEAPDQPPNFVGAGFLAQPTMPITPGVEPEDTVIDIFVARSDVRQWNERSDAKTSSRFAVDDSSMKYQIEDFPRQVTIRAREFVGVSPVAIKVTVKAGMKKVLTPDGEPAVTTFGDSVPPRPVAWFFAAAPIWQDSGNEPAEPDTRDGEDRPMMGRLAKEETMFVNQDQTRTPPDRVFRTAPKFDKPAEEYARVCRITWTPPKDATGEGEVKIEATP